MNRKHVWIMSAACGMSVANIYYNQPLLPAMASSFHAATSSVGYLPGFTQGGVAIGMFCFVPLGDMLERRSLIVTMCVAIAGAALLTAISPSIVVLLIAGFLTGITTVVPHLVLPFAAKLAPQAERGKVVGTVLGALLTGILLARVISGLMGDLFGWRSVYAGSAVAMLLLAIVLQRTLPRDRPDGALRYPDLLRSIWDLVKGQALLREAAVEGAMLFGAFSAFWSTLVFLLAKPPYHYGAKVAGLFGLVGAAGAAIAPVAGRFSDRKGPGFTVALGIATSLLSYVVFAAFGARLWGLVLGVVLLDVGVQAGHVANQTRIYALIPSARSRLNTVYMVSYFLGGSLGSALGAYGWNRFGWYGVCAVGAAMLLVAAAVRATARDHATIGFPK